MAMSIRLMALKVRNWPHRGRAAHRLQSRIIVPVIGEWIPAWGWMSLTFLVAGAGVVGLGWWVVRGDQRNRRFDDLSSEETRGPRP